MRAVFFIAVVLAFVCPVDAQRIAILQPDASATVDGLASKVRAGLSREFRILDDQLADAAYRSVAVADPFNLSTSESRRIGSVMGADQFILIRSAVQRRASLGSEAYFEGYAVTYLVSSRTGSLLDWHVESVRAASEKEAKEKLIDAAPKVSERLANALKVNRFAVVGDARFLEVPEEASPEANGLRTPVPYRRLRPEYTELASNYGVRATIDIEVDVDTDGTIIRTSIERWAGFGLEESVEKAVRSMNWRPAMRDGKPLPMRILLRYNFTKIEKDEAP